MTSLEQVDLAKNLAALAKVLTDVVVPKMHDYAAGLIIEWSTPEKADDLAAVLEETARHVRACKPTRLNSKEEPCSVVDSRPLVSRWKPVPPASAADSTPAAAIPTVGGVEASEKSANECSHCDGHGVIRWQQPWPDGEGGTILRDMEHPCPAGCGPEWKHPHAERGRVVESSGIDAPTRVAGQAKAAQQLHPLLDAELKRIYERYSRD
ncbi:hypothetical protein [Actinokineospora sp.]|uniref:hypothetical protein n=1 Tax=Actinokineospora sp. TaxID=1872133 RepID=UPI003D6C2FA2